jgi:hypothetical protein
LLSRKFPSELAVLLALLALAALAVRILLLLAGLLAAALLLAGLLTRVLILLTRVLVLIRHSGSPFFALLGTQRGDNGEGRVWFPKKLPVPARSLRGGGLAQLWPGEPGKNYPVQPFKPHLPVLPLRVPTVRK